MDLQEYQMLCREVETEYAAGLEELKRKYEERKRAIQLVWEISKQQSERVRGTVRHGEVIDSVRQILQDLHTAFSLRDVEAALKGRYPRTAASSSRKSISSALRRLRNEGVIEMIRHGKGKAPSVYVVAGQKSQDTAEAMKEVMLIDSAQK
jgi:hypothetical protein